MKKNETQDQAELYRQERKKRIAKQANQKAKKTPDAIKGVIRLRKIAAVVFAVIVVLGAAYGLLSFFGAPQKVLTAVKVDGERITVAEYNYYYMTTFHNVYQTAYSYDSQYGSGMGQYITGFDYTVSPDKQSIDDNGVTKLYSQYMHDYVLKSLEQNKYYYDEAIKEGLTLSDEDKEEIEDAIASISESAETNGYSLNRYLNRIYGKGVNEKLFRRVVEEQCIVQNYLSKIEEDKQTSVSDEEIDSVYNENKNDYDVVDLRVFGFEITTEAAEDDTDADESESTTGEATDEEETTTSPSSGEDEETTAEEGTTEEKSTEPLEEELKAQEMVSRVTDEASFIELCREYAPEDEKEDFEDENATLIKYFPYSNIESYISADAAEWVFDSAREPGDANCFTTSDYVYVLLLVNKPYKDDTLPTSVRHILIAFNTTDDDGNEIELTDEIKDEAKSTAETILAEYENGEKTEDAFAALANKYSSDYASTVGSSGEYEDDPLGGLYENIGKGEYVTPFEDWSFDETREYGDTGIIETTYGYHIMYFVGRQDEPEWKSTIRSNLTDEYMDDFTENVNATVEGTAKTVAIVTNWGYKKVRNTINNNYYTY